MTSTDFSKDSSTDSLSDSELQRYSRHLLISEVGIEGQRKLKCARVLVVGAGGLGSPVIQYLSAAGVGTIGIVDFDDVDKSNLQRQILFSNQDVGFPKVELAAKRALSLNPEISIHTHNTRLTCDNIEDIFADYSIVVDGSDNFETRYLVNDACVVFGKTNIHGAVHRFDGQVSVFAPGQGPCYRCVFSEPPVAGTFLNCAEAGVLGVLPGIVGTIQATECIKTILSIGTSLVGRLLLVDALDMSFRTIKLTRNLKCITCGDSPEVRSIQDLRVKHATVQTSCSGLLTKQSSQAESLTAASESSSSELSATQLDAELRASNDLLLIDVREPHEFGYSHLNRAVNLPLSRISERLQVIPAASNVVVYCKSGMRSQKAVALMREAGLSQVRHLTGGLSAWSKQVDSSMSVL
ncbi:MAG: molybdopterin-synthase adenylyltransferase MoeB [Candidatus Melainabacteria bacterium]|nr:MAG: molybdopterin-synthase adenylyltransferase MoeB [Candidatus Melainabacteria bacterium]